EKRCLASVKLMGCSWKLAQEAHVALEKDLQIVDAILEHRQSVHAHSEREAAHLARVVIHKTIHGGIHHTRAQKLNPARALALAARAARGCRAAAAAKNTGDVEFDGWFREREIARPEARLHAFAEELFYEISDGAGEIAKGDIGVDSQPFD